MFAVIVVFLRSELGLNPVAIGLVFSAGSVGGLLGAVFADKIGLRLGIDMAIRLASILRGIGLAALPLATLVPNSWAAVSLLVGARMLNACSWTVYEVLANTFQQTALADEVRGRATAGSLWMWRTAEACGAACATIAVGFVGLIQLLTIAAAGAALSSLATLAFKSNHGATSATEQSEPQSR